jgi:hypothetical protein
MKMSTEISKVEAQEVVQNKDEAAFALIQREAQALASSQLIPKQFQGKVADCIIALEMAKRINAVPMAVLQNIYIVHGKPSWSSTFIIAVINQCGRFDPLKFKYQEQNGETECIAYTTYKGTDDQVVGPKISTAMAKSEGWSTKTGSKWKTMPQLMLSYRAATFFGRLYCPDLLMGMHSVEEHADFDSKPVQAEEKVKSDILGGE